MSLDQNQNQNRNFRSREDNANHKDQQGHEDQQQGHEDQQQGHEDQQGHDDREEEEVKVGKSLPDPDDAKHRLQNILLDLFEQYKQCKLRRLSVGALLPLSAEMQRSLKARAAKERVDQPQDALETTLDLLLSILPKYGRVTESVTITDAITGHTRQVSKKDTQVIYVVPQGAKTLQSCIDRFELPTAINATHTHCMTFEQPDATLFLLFNEPGGDYELRANEIVVIAKQRFQIAGLLLYSCRHYSTLLRKDYDTWILCNDLSVSCDNVQNFSAFIAQVGLKSVRGIVLRRADKPFSHGLHEVVNFTNKDNSCYMSAILQLMFNCGSYMKRLAKTRV
jgi:hypothetical protein